ncbi:MAG: hypothetical protein HN700_20015 [Verrucomicrobia bacterium]|nr:hypothetical protein [Verrucomicrobiota bacterium]
MFGYTYLVGGVIFVVGLIYAFRQGYFSLRGLGLRHLLATLFVLTFFVCIQGYLQYAPMKEAPAVAYTGGAEHVLDVEGKARGTTLDYSIMIGYFVAILIIGTWFGRRQKTTKDFFFGGQRFSCDHKIVDRHDVPSQTRCDFTEVGIAAQHHLFGTDTASICFDCA